LKIDANSLVPIYVQIANAIEDDILSGTLEECGNCYSQLVIAKELTVNPATAAKGINLLVGREILEKQRGLAMIITPNAKKKIMNRRKNETFEKLVKELINTAKKLELSQDYVHETIKKHYKEDK
jgi:GntR family transcriptional regulator